MCPQMTERHRTYFSFLAMLINIAHIHIIIACGSHRVHPCVPASNPPNNLSKKMLSSFPSYARANKDFHQETDVFILGHAERKRWY